jgi:hypothetical protein
MVCNTAALYKTVVSSQRSLTVVSDVLHTAVACMYYQVVAISRRASVLRKSDSKRKPGGRPSNSSTTNSKSGGPRCSNEGFNAAEGDTAVGAAADGSVGGAGQSRPSLSKKVCTCLYIYADARCSVMNMVYCVLLSCIVSAWPLAL